MLRILQSVISNQISSKTVACQIKILKIIHSNSPIFKIIINKLINNQKISLNSCDTIIDYLYINDFCTAIDEIIKFKVDGVYNICSGNEYKILDIIDFLYKNISHDQIISLDPSLDREHSSRYICGSNTKLKLNTNWNNSVQIEVGLLQLIQYYKLYNENK